MAKKAVKLPPGVQVYETARGVRYRVRWREDGQQKSRSFVRPKDAESFYAETILARNQERRVNVPRSAVTLAEFVKFSYWPDYAEVKLEASTRLQHKRAWNKLILPRLGHKPLTAIDTEDLTQWQTAIRKAGAGDATIIRAAAVLSSIYKYAQQLPRTTGVKHNPVKAMEKPKRQKAKRHRVYAPLAFETMRAASLRCETKYQRTKGQRDALILSFLAYAGLRPGEILYLRPEHIRDNTVVVEGSISLGAEKETKTDEPRTVPLHKPLQEDIEDWIEDQRIGYGELLFPNKQGEPWNDYAYRNWRRRRWKPLARIASGRLGIPQLGVDRPYCGRHSFASLMLRAGWSANIKQLAKYMGHDATVLIDTYGHEIEEYEGTDPIDIETEIYAAREQAEQDENERERLGEEAAAELAA